MRQPRWVKAPAAEIITGDSRNGALKEHRLGKKFRDGTFKAPIWDKGIEWTQGSGKTSSVLFNADLLTLWMINKGDSEGYQKAKEAYLMELQSFTPARRPGRPRKDSTTAA